MNFLTKNTQIYAIFTQSKLLRHSMVFLKNNDCVVKIDKGELISFRNQKNEFIHQKGNKGWGKSDDEMFPIIGRTKANNYRVQTSNGDAIQDQHGLLRELDYDLVSSDINSATFIKNYAKNTQIKNTKFPEKSTEEFIFWPYNFTFKKEYHLQNNTVNIKFTLTSEKEMPFMLGYHPAFLLSDTNTESLICKGKEFTLQDVINAGADAYPVLNSNKITLKNTEKEDLEITTKGFDNFMLWTEVNNMLCIEPITLYPVPFNENLSEKDMQLSSGLDAFSVSIKIL